MKRISTLTLTLVIIICFSTVSANAGPARRHTIEGFVLGTGVALIGSAIIHGMNKEKQCVPNYPRHKRQANNRHEKRYARSNGPRGHWKIQKIWVADRTQKRWNPGHYTPRGNWVDGRYQRVRVKDGHWQTQKVWVRR